MTFSPKDEKPSLNPPDDERRWQDQFLTWYAGLGAPLIERNLGVSGFRYHQFATLIPTVDGYSRPAHGRSQNRRIAAIKCAAEAIEREFAVRYFKSAPSHVPAIRFEITSEGFSSSDSVDVEIPPFGLRTSNGWAVHRSGDRAKTNAIMEALERHLLLKSFLKYGWDGFRVVQEIQNEEIRLFFLTSKLSVAGHVAGLVAAHSPLYPGVAFGHSVGKSTELESFQFWECPIFEAIDKILSMNGKAIEIKEEQNSWITSEIKDYLETPFDFSLLTQGKDSPQVADSTPFGFLSTFDLAASRDLKFPVHAALAWGGSFIPLYHQSALGNENRPYFERILALNGIYQIPEKHPIT
jgi:hypothetical protein